MSQINNLLNHSVGIEQISTAVSEGHIPQAKTMASNTVFDASLSAHYNLDGFKENLNAMLEPSVGDGEVLRPEIFNQTVKKLIEEMLDPNSSEDISNDMKSMVDTILVPLIENKALLDTYTFLLVSG